MFYNARYVNREKSNVSMKLARVRMYILLLMFLPVFHQAPASGQGILNTEKYEQNLNKSYNIAGKFGYEGARGNTVLDKADFEFMTMYHYRRHILRLVGGFNYLNNSGSVITNSVYSQLRYNHVFTEDLQSFTFYQVQKNEILLVRRRELLGAGLRIALVRADSSLIKLDAGIGGMYENELLNSPVLDNMDMKAENYFRMTDFLSCRYRYKNVRIIDVLYYQPLFSDFTDFRLYNDLTFQFAIVKHLSFETDVIYRYDSRPPGDLKRWDFGLKNSIAFNF
jgi:putative salt-induced outer membrane protein YdiY